MFPNIDIVIVNWNAGTQLNNCIFSLSEVDKERLNQINIILVDNASADNSLEGINKFGLPLRIIRNAENRGFAAACNQGAHGSGADYLLFLNPDMALFRDSLAKAVAFMEISENSKIGILGIQLLDESGGVSRSCARFPSTGSFLSAMLGLNRIFPGRFPGHFMTDWDHGTNREVDQVMGAFFLVRRLLFEDMGGFDERFFVYFEELDFSLRARIAGWRSFYLADAAAFHKGCGTSDQVKGARLFYSLRSRILYGFKHFGTAAATALALATLLIEPVSRSCLAIARRSGGDLAETLRGSSMLWRSLPHILKIAMGCRSK